MLGDCAPPHTRSCLASARTQALLRPIAPGKVTASFAPLGRVLFWELFLRAGAAALPRPSCFARILAQRIKRPKRGGTALGGYNQKDTKMTKVNEYHFWEHSILLRVLCALVVQ
jgi:hypothetical protein